jgi:hypothetical protein
MSETTEHPIPAQTFVKTLTGSADEVFSRLILIEHRYQNKTKTEWHAALNKLRGLPEDAPEAPAGEEKAAEAPAAEAAPEEHV